MEGFNAINDLNLLFIIISLNVASEKTLSVIAWNHVTVFVTGHADGVHISDAVL